MKPVFSPTGLAGAEKSDRDQNGESNNFSDNQLKNYFFVLLF